ncbi:MAG: hypothetical protein QF466_08185 [Desulfobacterales bacterium]|nr:hypothetical protein [Desulfobacterales bacterium]
MAFTNTGGGANNVAPHGGHERQLSKEAGIRIPDHIPATVNHLGRSLGVDSGDHVPGLPTDLESGDQQQKTW